MPTVKVGYLVNQYPQTSVTFVRREIAALEQHGVEVCRYSVRRWDGELVDSDDRAEAKRTKVLLDAGVANLVKEGMRQLLSRPARVARAFARAIRWGRKSDRGVFRHLVYLLEACVLYRLAKKDNLGWLHCHFGTNSTTVAALCRDLGGPPFSFTVHGPEEFDRPEALSLPEKIAAAELVIGVSQFGRSQLYRWCPPSQWDKLEVVHCGLDGALLEATLAPLPVDSSLLTCVARLHEQKGALLLLETIRRLKASGVVVELNLIGDGPLRAEVEERVARYGLQGCVHLLGWQSQSQIRESLQRSRAMVLPSFAEGLPVVLMESLALRRPVITTYVAGIPELVKPGESGWIVPAGSITDLYDAILSALETPAEELRSMGERGAALVAERHSAATEASRLAGHIQKRIRSAQSEGQR